MGQRDAVILDFGADGDARVGVVHGRATGAVVSSVDATVTVVVAGEATGD